MPAATVRRLVTVAILALLALPGVARASAAAPAARSRAGGSTPKVLLALGDSLAAGYQPTDGNAPPPVNPATGLTDQGYPGSYAADLAKSQHLALVDLACPGETTVSFTTTPAQGACASFYEKVLNARNQEQAALNELAQSRGEVRLVTFDLGANDVDRCFKNGSLHLACIPGAAASAVSHLRPILAKLTAALAKDDPGAHLVAMNYYDPFLGLAEDPGGARGLALAALSLPAADLFNRALEDAYAHAKVPVANVAAAFATADLTHLGLYAGHRLPLDVVRICQLTYMCPPPSGHQDIHPNTSGYAKIATAFEKILPKP